MQPLWMMVLPVVAMGAAGLAQTPQDLPARDDPGGWTLTVYWENDGGVLKRNHVEDKHYTNGVAVTVAGRPRFADRLAEYVPWGNGMDRTAAGFVAGQLMFTPEDISRSDLVEDDRPYAGYLYAGAYWQRASASTFDHVELNAGVIGAASQAENLQDSVHEAFNGVEPRGWDHQLNDEPQVQAYVRRKWRIDLNPIDVGDMRIESQFIPQAGLALGTVYRHLEAAATLRVGWRLPDDFGPGHIGDLPSATAAPAPGWFGYGFVRAGGRLVEHNVFLSGNNFQGSHGVDEEPLVGDLSAGLALGYHSGRWAGQLGYSQTVVSEAFKGQDGSDEYASLNLSFTGWF